MIFYIILHEKKKDLNYLKTKHSSTVTVFFSYSSCKFDLEKFQIYLNYLFHKKIENKNTLHLLVLFPGLIGNSCNICQNFKLTCLEKQKWGKLKQVLTTKKGACKFHDR